MGLNLSDLGIEPEPPSHPARSPRPNTEGTLDHLTALADLPEVYRHGDVLDWVVSELGIREAVRCLRAAVNQKWGANRDAMPSVAVIVSAATDSDIDDLAAMLQMRFTPRIAVRIVELLRRYADQHLTTHPMWQGGLADEGVTYEEMSRRALIGEFDDSGPVRSTFDWRSKALPDR